MYVCLVCFLSHKGFFDTCMNKVNGNKEFDLLVCLLACHTYVDMGHPFLWSYPRTRDIHICCRALSKEITAEATYKKKRRCWRKLYFYKYNYLKSKYAERSSCWNLFGSKPHRCYPSRKTQSKNLCNCTNCLANIRTRNRSGETHATFSQAPRALRKAPATAQNSNTLLFKQKGGWENQGNVDNLINHR